MASCFKRARMDRGALKAFSETRAVRLSKSPALVDFYKTRIHVMKGAET